MFHNPLPTNRPIAAPSCSIPSRFQTYVVDTADKKGFNSGTRRFNPLELVGPDTPGPGHYNHEIKPSKRNVKSDVKSYPKQSPAFSDFLANSKFQTPGPNNYNVSKPLSLRKDFHRANSSSFQSVRNISKKFQTPAPNVYNPQGPKIKSITAPFKSNSIRTGLDVMSQKRVPSPTHYLVRDSMVKSSVRAPTSCFLSNSGRSSISKKSARDAFYSNSRSSQNSTFPGPAAYCKLSQWGNFKKRQELSRKGHYLAISAPALPLPAQNPFPGPGQYELVDYSGPKKEKRGSSMFCSNTDRWVQDKRDSSVSKQLPGPASYNPKALDNQSFLFNARKHWTN